MIFRKNTTLDFTLNGTVYAHLNTSEIWFNACYQELTKCAVHGRTFTTNLNLLQVSC